MKIVIIGSGNVATQLGKALKKSGHRILQVYSRNEPAAKLLAKKLSCPFTTTISSIFNDSDAYMVALTDAAIGPFLKMFSIRDKLIFHTSGSISLAVFGNYYKHCSVFYPVQTFSMKREVNFKDIPVCIEASDFLTRKKITALAKTLTSKIHYLDSKQRKVIHLAAVFSNNFSNHLFMIAENLLLHENISFDVLKPLILETVLKVQHESPTDMQTGPAKRGDALVLQEHLKMLSKKKQFREIYKLLSESISEMSGIRL